MTCITVVEDSPMDQMLIAGLLRTNPEYHIGLVDNGREALRRIADAPPHLVVSDLIMPEMDGFEFVRQMRKRFSQIPVILMTAYGNESIAVKALEAGAASYVPKAQQAELLMKTIERVLAHCAVERQRSRVAQCVTEFHGKFTLDNDPALIPPLINELQTRLAGVGVGDATERVRTAVALEEAILNAMYHGNLEITAEEIAEARSHVNSGRLTYLIERRRGLPQYQDRKIGIDAHITAEGARFSIHDDGHGFDFPAASTRSDSGCFENGQGRGLMLIRSLVDEVRYNHKGNEVTLVKHVRPEASS